MLDLLAGDADVAEHALIHCPQLARGPALAPLPAQLAERCTHASEAAAQQTIHGLGGVTGQRPKVVHRRKTRQNAHVVSNVLFARPRVAGSIREQMKQRPLRRQKTRGKVAVTKN
ncbi:MAG TPA: hypothetical protein VG966_09815 [Hyphomicrobiaceae bacterium]|nr:hypothetical protein [Hyphomicrobiaceae bacterium]